MHGWQVYVWTFSAVVVFSGIGRVFLFFKHRDKVSRLDLLEGFVGIAAIPALFGFAYQKSYGPHAVWIGLTCLLVALSIYQFFTPKMKLIYKKGWLTSVALIGLQTLIGAPALWALFKYSFLQPALWI